jgi:hypothetical protein
MKREPVLRILVSATLLLALAGSLAAAHFVGAAQGPTGPQGPAPQGGVVSQAAAGTTFTYQGQLQKDGSNVNAFCDMAFRLYDDPAAGSLVGGPLTRTVFISDGLFTAPLDFGAAAFTGAARWLEIAVQCPGDAGFNLLTPRQALTAAPYALGLVPGAQVIGEVSGGAVVTGQNTAIDGWAMGVYGWSDSWLGVGVGGLASATSGWASGVLGVSDSTAGHGVWGHATAISGMTYGVYGLSYSTAGFGVYGYADNYTGTTYGVYGTSDSPGGYGGYFSNSSAGVGLAAQSAGGNLLEAYTGIERRFYVDHFGLAYAAGDVPLLPRAVAPAANILTTLDSAGDVGYGTSITIGADGRGLISYGDATNGDLKVAHCADTACTAATLTTLDSAGDVGGFTSITLGADGLGLVSYYDNTNGDLKVAHCADTACSAATLTTLDSAGDVGWYTSITLGADGLGLVSYYDWTRGALKVAHCADTACTAATLAILDSTANVGRHTSITIGADGLGLISYFDRTNYDLKVAHCSSTFCVPCFRPR